jgi:MFS family permease
MLAAPMASDLGIPTPTVYAAFSGAMVVSALVGPWAGQAIDRRGGRVVLVGTSLIFALGLAMLGLSEGLWTMVAAWLIIGVAMGAGNGILTIAKGTLPLVLFGAQGYGARQGWLMMPARIAQALAPLLFGLALDAWGANALWLSGAIGLAAGGALMLLRAQPPESCIKRGIA